jgi:hypothetical protein
MAPTLAAAILLLLWLPSTRWIGPKTTRIWKGYYTLLVRADRVGEDRVRQALESIAPGVISSATAMVSFSDLETTTACPLAALAGRLDTEDPRFDEYLRGLGGYFRGAARGAEMQVAYIPARRTSAATFRMLSRLLGASSRGRWRLVEHDPVEKVPVLLAAIAFGLLASVPASASRRRRKEGLAGLAVCCMVCWLPFLASGGIAELAFTLAVFPSWLSLARARGASSPAARRARGSASVTYGAFAAAALAGLLLVAGFSGFRLLGALCSIACSVLILLLPRPVNGLWKVWKRARAFPSATLGRLSRVFPRRAPAVAALLVVSPVLLALVALVRAPFVPLPSRVPGIRDFSSRALREMDARELAPEAKRLPDIVDFVTHGAYQQTLTFGRPYMLPTLDERVTVTEYVVNRSTGAIVARPRTVKTFDSAWWESLTRRPAVSSVERLLLAQGRPVSVEAAPARRALAREIAAAALCALALLWWFARELGVPLPRLPRLPQLPTPLELRHLIPDRLWRFTNAARKTTTR